MTALSLRRAVVMLICGKADMVHDDPSGPAIHSATRTVPVPSVIIPTRYWGLNKAAASALTVGEGTGTMDVAKVGLAFMNVSRGDGLTLTVPVQGAAVTTAAACWTCPSTG